MQNRSRSQQDFRVLHPFKAEWLLYVPPALTYKHPLLGRYSVYICFVGIPLKTSISQRALRRSADKSLVFPISCF
jgi:hypothetical protein